ncbi:MAG: insulinase family protein, partial [Sphaerochaetaceae bacterium]|nr:insulinase family protein [Sphaerochaetaceae bacterium]
MFNTPSEDDKGIAHIIEHTVLCGSKRFPVKDPFSQAILSSPNTFLNAMTFSDKTMYPLASPLKKDFDNLFDIYADAVFAPLLRRESFMQEGIRNIETFDGIVFNEMCGSRSTEDAIVQAYSTKALFEGTPAQYESGGVPLAIADLTYEEYLERYKKWYSPSNCRLFMFGDLDIEEYLNKLEKRYLEDVQRGLTIVEDFNNYKKEKPKAFRTKAYCPTKNANTILLTWLTQPASDPFERLTLNLLVSILLGNPGAPLYKAIIESGLGEDLSPQSGMDPDYPIMPFSVGFCGAKKGHEDEIEEFLLKTLKDFVEKGIPEAAISSAMKRQEFKLLEVKSSDYPYGIATAIGVSRVWLRGVDPFEGLKNKELFEKLKNEV